MLTVLSLQTMDVLEGAGPQFASSLSTGGCSCNGNDC